jgi:hypothetical protein
MGSRTLFIVASRSVTFLLVMALSSIGCSSHSEEAPGASGDAGNDRLPTIAGPVTGGCTGKPFPAAPLNLASYGYLEAEYFMKGSATAYGWASPPSADGMWSVRTTTSAHYKTRLLVRRPSDPSRFNGTVIVEWLNVTAGMDLDPDFGYAHVELLRSGYAYVGVSAQAEGVIGGSPSPLGIGSLPLVQEDPERYGSLRHPGDDYSYDIYTQAAHALRHPGPIDPLGGLMPARLIGDGESQSAFRLVTYVDAIQPIARAFDAFFIHSRWGYGALLSGSAGAGVAALLEGPGPARIRGDLGVPVFQLETETDVLGLIPGKGFSAARQPDTDDLRTWEVAGTAHADQYLLDFELPAYQATGCNGGDSGAASIITSCGSVNAGQQHWVEDAAIHALNAWTEHGQLPPMALPLVLADAGNAFATDAYGNTLGGVRTPALDVPIATYSGQAPSSASLVCSLLGQTTPLSATQLMTLYPTQADYVSKVSSAAMQGQQGGWLLSADIPFIEMEAQSAPLPQ